MRRLSISFVVLLLSACATDEGTRVLPREDGTITAISIARDEATAAGANVKKANRYCEKQHQRAVFLDEKSDYRGILPQQGEAAGRVLKKIPVIGEDLTSDADYQVTTNFKCLPAE